MAPSSAQSANLMSLSVELRLEIYSHVFSDFVTDYDNTEIFSVTEAGFSGGEELPDRVPRPQGPALIQTCRLIRTEALPELIRAIGGARDVTRARYNEFDQIIETLSGSEDTVEYSQLLDGSSLWQDRTSDLSGLKFHFRRSFFRMEDGMRRCEHERWMTKYAGILARYPQLNIRPVGQQE